MLLVLLFPMNFGVRTNNAKLSPLDENHPTRSSDVYATKWLGEEMAEAFARR